MTGNVWGLNVSRLINRNTGLHQVGMWAERGNNNKVRACLEKEWQIKNYLKVYEDLLHRK